jgi:polygalacturonase
MRLFYTPYLTVLVLIVCEGIFSNNNLVYGSQNYLFDVKEYGARGDGQTYDTDAIQKLIDRVYQTGGGTIYFPAGKYLTKTLILKDNINLKLDNGAVLLGSTEMHEFLPDLGSFKDSGGRKFGAAVIFAADAKNISIEGNGIIDGQGYAEYYPADKSVARPSIIRFIRCTNVKIQDVTLRNSAAWVSHYVECEDLTIRGVTIRSYANKNNDGIDIVGCQRVIITECNIDTEDDSIVLKALTEKACRDVVISNCIISGLKSAIKTGTESLGNFENISISNCSIYGTRGISLLSVDGGTVENVTIANISMRDSYAVIVMRLGERMRPYNVPEGKRPNGPGKIKNISIDNLQAINVTESNDFISGIPGHYIEDITLSNININFIGGGKKEDSAVKLPEDIDGYPKAKMFGILPAYGMYIRHARNLTLDNIQYNYQNVDYRSVLVCEDVEHITIDKLQAPSSATAAPFIDMTDTRHTEIRFCKPLTNIDTFLQAKGNSREITLIYNDLSKCKTKTNLNDIQDKSSFRIIE